MEMFIIISLCGIMWLCWFLWNMEGPTYCCSNCGRELAKKERQFFDLRGRAVFCSSKCIDEFDKSYNEYIQSLGRKGEDND